MSTKEEKKIRILNALSRIEEQNKSLKQTLDKIYQEPDIKHELEFVSMCNKIQKTAREAIAETGYYKNLESFKRDLYAPHELEGDATEFIDVIKSNIHDIEYPKVNRVYKINPQAENLFDVTIEPVAEPTRAISNDIEDQIYPREVWQECMDKFVNDVPFGGVNLRNGTKIIFDEDIIAAAYTFMLGPVTALRKKAIVAETLRFPSFEELKEHILNEAKDKDMLLYMVCEDTHKTYGEDLTVINERPVFIWRGAFLDKE